MTIAQQRLEPKRWTLQTLFCPSCGRHSHKWLRVEGITHRYCHKCGAFLRIERMGFVLNVQVRAK